LNYYLLLYKERMAKLAYSEHANELPKHPSMQVKVVETIHYWPQ